MKIGKLEITLNNNKKLLSNMLKNSYSDSVAGRLSNLGFRVNINGRPTGKAYSAEQIEELYIDYTFGAIKKIRNRVADILLNNIEVYDASEGNPTDSPSLAKIRHPYQDAIDNSQMDNSLFFQGIATFMIINGEAFLFAGERTMKAGNIKLVKNFELLQSNMIIRTYDSDGILKSYKEQRKITNGMVKTINYVPSNIIAITDINPIDLRKGYGMIRPIIDSISLENMTKKLQIATIANGIKSPGIISTKEKIEQDDFENLKNQVEARWTSNDMDKAGTPIVTNGGFVEYTSITEDLDKLAMKKIRELNRDSFIAALGVSKTTFGIEESGTTRDVSKTQTENFIIDTCMPIAEAIINGLNQDYINNYPTEYNKKRLKMRLKSPVPKDLEREKVLAEIESIRSVTFKNYIESGMDANQAANIAGIIINEGEKIKIVEKLTNNVVNLINEQMPMIARVPSTKENKPLNIHTHIHHHDDNNITNIVDTNKLTVVDKNKIKKAENELRKKVSKIDGELGYIYIVHLNNIIEEEEREKYINELSEAVMAYYLIAIGIFGKRRTKQLANDFEKDISPFNFTNEVKRIISERITKVSNEHFQTINESLNKIIQQGVKEELSNIEIIEKVTMAIENDIKQWQVERFVRTETTNAYRQAVFHADRQFIIENGYTGRAYKIWRTNSVNPCVFCKAKEQEAEKVPFEENFWNIGDMAEATTIMPDGKIKQIFFPIRFVGINAGGLHPNCMCDYQLILE